MSAATAAALFAGALGTVGLLELGAPLVRRLALRTPGWLRRVAAVVEAIARAGGEGRDPGALERRRLLALAAIVALGFGTLVAGPLLGVGLAAAGPWVASSLLAARRERYRRAVAREAGAIATGVADAIGGGHSPSGALVEAAQGVTGPARRELARVARQLELGTPIELALDALRARARSQELDVIVAAILLQRRAGGDLAALLRDCARSFSDQARLEGEARAATAQARFTGLVVVGLPLAGAILAELASPGFVAGLFDGFLTAWLVGLAIGLQLAAAVVIGRLGRVAT